MSEVPAQALERLGRLFDRTARSETDLVQLEAGHAGAHSWDYREQGPEVWQVPIGRASV